MIRKLILMTLLFSFPVQQGFAQETIPAISIKAFPLGQEYRGHLERDVEFWTREAINEIFSFDYTNWREKLEFSSRHFSESAWNEFVKQSYAMPDLVKANQQTVTPRVDSITEWQKSDKDDKSIFHYEALVVLTYASGKQAREDSLIIRMTVESKRTELGLYPQITYWDVRGVGTKKKN